MKTTNNYTNNKTQIIGAKQFKILIVIYSGRHLKDSLRDQHKMVSFITE